MSTISVADAPDVVQDDLPPSCKLVWLALATNDGSEKYSQLQEQTGLHQSTLSDALTRLRDHDIAYRASSTDDMREQRYTLYDCRREAERYG